MKIISGKYRGRNVDIPDIARPTLSRHRQSLFDVLESLNSDHEPESFFENKIILDCFAGSGALGIESLSRGAKHAYFVDNHKNAISVLRSNITKLRIEHFSTIIQSDISKIKNIDKKVGDLVFFDPPYEKSATLIIKTINHLFKSKWISEKSILVMETPGEFDIFQQNMFNFDILSSRKIGNSLFTIVKCLKQKR